MAKKCFLTGKSSLVINSVIRKGRARADGGVGKKTTGITKTRKYANLQKRSVEVNGKRMKVWLSVAALRKLPDHIRVL
ncbi:MAG: L28 family ribosomal protein [Deinococcaceae bacterium]